MAYQAPHIHSKHVLKEAGIGAITTSVAAAAGFPLERLLDDRKNVNFKFSTSAANHHVTVDRGAGLAGPDDNVNRLIIPAGHNLSGAAYSLEGSADPPSWPGTVIKSGSFAAGLNKIATSVSIHQHLRMRITATGQWEFGELVWTKAETLSAGPDAAFEDYTVGRYAEVVTSGQETYRRQLGATRRVINMRWNYLDGSDDQRVIDALVTDTNGGVDPFYLLGPDDSKTTVHVRLVEEIRTPNASSNPGATGIVPALELRMIEALE